PDSVPRSPQILNMVVDTGSSDVVVAGSRCEFSGCPLTESQLYNFTQSSTMGNKSTESTTIPFGEGTATGFIVADTVTLGAFSVSGIEFLEAEEIIDGPPAGQVSGLVGLGGAARSHLTAVPFWETLILRNSLPQPEFSIWLARVGSAPPDRTSFPGGAFIFGGVNESLYAGDIEFLDSGGAEAQFWTLNLTSLKSQNVPVDITGSSPIASIDTGIYGVLGPPAIVAAMYAHVPGANSPGNDGFWQFPCNTSVNVSVSFGGREWDITPADMNLGPTTPGSTICNGAILGQDVNFNGSTTQIRWVFGVPFLRGVYSVFKQNPAQIGFAQLSEAAGGPGMIQRRHLNVRS
ncbi:aspartic peptidase A1, partial [Mycena amicta]